MLKKIILEFGQRKFFIMSSFYTLLLVSSLMLVYNYRNEIWPKNRLSLSNEVLNLTDQIALTITLAGYDPKMSKALAAVSLFETGGGTSNLFHKNKNLFGMKHPARRQTQSFGPDTNGFAQYFSKEASINDLILYLMEFDYPDNLNGPDKLVRFMKSKGYFEEDLNVYLNGVKAYYEII